MLRCKFDTKPEKLGLFAYGAILIIVPIDTLCFYHQMQLGIFFVSEYTVLYFDTSNSKVTTPPNSVVFFEDNSCLSLPP